MARPSTSRKTKDPDLKNFIGEVVLGRLIASLRKWSGDGVVKRNINLKNSIMKTSITYRVTNKEGLSSGTFRTHQEAKEFIETYFETLPAAAKNYYPDYWKEVQADMRIEQVTEIAIPYSEEIGAMERQRMSWIKGQLSAKGFATSAGCLWHTDDVIGKLENPISQEDALGILEHVVSSDSVIEYINDEIQRYLDEDEYDEIKSMQAEYAEEHTNTPTEER